MQWQDVQTVLAEIGVETSSLRPSGGKVMLSCPLAWRFHADGDDSRPSMSLWFAETPAKYRCYACHEKGTLADLVESCAALTGRQELRATALRVRANDKPTIVSEVAAACRGVDDWLHARACETILFEKSLENFVPAWANCVCRGYLEGRGVGADLTDFFGLRYDCRGFRIVFPVRNKKGQLVGAQGRALGGQATKYLPYFGVRARDHLGAAFCLTGAPRLLVVEGFFDLLRVWPWRRDLDVVCTWGAEMSDRQAAILAGLDKTIIVGFDDDPAGWRGWKAAWLKLRGCCTCLQRVLPPAGKDFGEVTEDEFLNAIGG